MKKYLGTVAGLVGLIVGLAVFLGWLSVVGNPHVVETVIGLVLGVVAGVWSYVRLRRFAHSV